MKSMTTHQDNIIDFSKYHTDVLSSSPKCKPNSFHHMGVFLETCSSISIIVMTVAMTVHILLS